jgi:hypothetical protein
MDELEINPITYRKGLEFSTTRESSEPLGE